MMDHPCISKVLDAGATDKGRPYFVMELVKGIHLTEYCDQNNLTTTERLNLFIDICGAVQHAHQKWIIHRDLKPTNVMVTIADGRAIPKVIDFGIAKATSQRLTEKTVFTEFRQLIGTPEYMSPEQAEMSGLDVDTRTDIYSLGVLLYELLTGTTPFDPVTLCSKGHAEIQRIIREEEPHKPSTRLSTMLGDTAATIAKHHRTDIHGLRRDLSGDLDWIVMKSIEKDRTRRYDTANAMAMDVRRHLNHEPVLAMPPSTTYRLRKFIRRNKTPMTVAAVVFLVAVIGGIVSFVFGVAAVRARDEMNIARQEAQQAFENEAAEHERAEAALVEAQGAREAEAEARSQAETAQVIAEKRAYSAALHTAAGDLERNDVRSLRRQLENAPEHLRGWEWDYLYHEADRSLGTPLELPPETRGYHMRLSPDASRVAVRGSVQFSEPIRVYDTHTGEMLRELATRSSNFGHFTFSHDNRWLGYDHRSRKHFQIYDLVNGNRLLQGDEADDAKWFLGFDPTGTRAAVRMKSSGTLSLFELDGWKLITSRDDVLPDSTNVWGPEGVFSPDGAMLAVACRARAPVRIFNAEDLSLVHEFDDTEDICSIAYADDGSRFATLSVSPPMITIYDSSNWEELRRINLGGEDWRGEVRFVRNSAGLLDLAATRRDGTIDIFRDSGTHVMTLRGEISGAQSIAFDAQSHEFISAHQRGVLRRWDSVRAGQGITPNSLALSIAPDWRTVQVGMRSRPNRSNRFKQVGSFDLVSRRLLGLWRYMPRSLSHSSGAADLARSPDGRFMAVATRSGWNQGRLKIFDLQTGLGAFTDDDYDLDDLTAVAWSGDRATIAVAGERGIIYLYDGSTYEPTGRLFGHYAQINDLLFTPDHVTLYAADANGRLRVWDTASKSELNALGEAGDPALQCLALSVDQGQVLAGGADGRIHVWSADTLESITTLDAHGGAVRTLAFSPDGARLASGSLDRSVKLWNPTGWEEILTLRTTAGVYDFEFTPDGSRLVMLLNNGTMRSFDAAPEIDRVQQRQAELAARTEAQSLVSSLMSRYQDPALIRPLVVNDDTITEAVREAALIELQVEALKLFNEAYDFDRLKAGLYPELRRWVLLDLVVSGVGRGWVDLDRFAKHIAAHPDRTDIERQAAMEFASGLRFNRVNTNNFAAVIARDSERSDADYALALFASEADNKIYTNQWANLSTKSLCEYRCGLYESAIETAQQSVKAAPPSLQPGHPETLAVLTLVLARFDRLEEARESLDQAQSQMEKDRFRNDDETRSFIDEVEAVLAPPETERVREPASREQVLETWRAHATSELSEIDAEISQAKLALHEEDFDTMLTHGRKANDAMRLLDEGDSPRVAEWLRWMGLRLRDHEQYDEAAAVLREAWMVAQRVLGNDHHLTLFALVDLEATLRNNLKRYAESEPLCREAMDIDLRHWGETSRRVAWRNGDLGSCLTLQQKHDEAEPYFLESLRIMRSLQAEDHIDVTWAIGFVRWHYQQSKQYDKLESFQRDVIKVARERLGDENQEVFDRTAWLANTLWRQDRFEDAVNLFRDCLYLAKRIHGEAHESVELILHAIARVHVKAEQYEQAITALEQAIEVGKQFRDEDDAIRFSFPQELMDVLMDHGPVERQYEVSGHLLAMARETWPDDDTKLASGLVYHGIALVHMQRFAEAEPLLRECIEIRQRTLDEGHWLIPDTQSWLGEALAGLERYDEAEPLLVESAEAILADEAPPLLRKRQAVERVIAFYESWDKPDQANTWSERLTALNE